MTKIDYPTEISDLFTPVQIRYHHYNNGNLCCMLWDVKENIPFCVVTKNIHDLGSKEKAYVDINNGGEALLYFLIDNKIASSTGSSITQGYCYYPLFEFKLDMADKIFYFINDVK